MRDTAVTGCGVTVVTGMGQTLSAHATDDLARELIARQTTSGEGPSHAAAQSGAAIHMSDLGDPADRDVRRWPTFAAEAVALGTKAAFAFPLLLGTASVGALSLFRSTPGELGPDHANQAWLAAGAVAQALAEEGDALAGLNPDGDPMRIHQAAGMAMVQLGVPIDDALSRLRALAYAEGQTTEKLAEEIVSRRRRLTEEER